MRVVAGALLIVLVLGVASGCGGKHSKSAATEATFESVPWILASGIDVAGLERTPPSATFVDYTVGGSTGCNQFEARYTVDGASLSIGRIVSTLAGCSGPRGAIERAYVTALEKVAAWRMEDEKLILVDNVGNELLRYDAATPAGDWEATAIQTGTALKSPPAGAAVTARFGADGTLTGSGGCNTYTTTYTTDRGTIHIAPPTATRMACAKPEGVMELEAAYFAALPTATHYRVDGGSLALLRADGTFVASYVRR